MSRNLTSTNTKKSTLTTAVKKSSDAPTPAIDATTTKQVAIDLASIERDEQPTERLDATLIRAVSVPRNSVAPASSSSSASAQQQSASSSQPQQPQPRHFHLSSTSLDFTSLSSSSPSSLPLTIQNTSASYRTFRLLPPRTDSFSIETPSAGLALSSGLQGKIWVHWNPPKREEEWEKQMSWHDQIVLIASTTSSDALSSKKIGAKENEQQQEERITIKLNAWKWKDDVRVENENKSADGESTGALLNFGTVSKNSHALSSTTRSFRIKNYGVHASKYKVEWDTPNSLTMDASQSEGIIEPSETKEIICKLHAKATKKVGAWRVLGKMCVSPASASSSIVSAASATTTILLDASANIVNTSIEMLWPDSMDEMRNKKGSTTNKQQPSSNKVSLKSTTPTTTSPTTDSLSSETVSHIYFGSLYYNTTKTLTTYLWNNSPEERRFVVDVKEKELGDGKKKSKSKATDGTTSSSSSPIYFHPSLTVSPRSGVIPAYTRLALTWTCHPRITEKMMRERRKGWKSMVIGEGADNNHAHADTTVDDENEQDDMKGDEMDVECRVVTSTVNETFVVGENTSSSSSSSHAQNKNNTSNILTLPITSSFHLPSLHLSPSDQYDFHHVPVNDYSDQFVEFKNRSYVLPLSFMCEKIAHFHCTPSMGVLKPRETLRVRLTFNPRNLGVFKERKVNVWIGEEGKEWAKRVVGKGNDQDTAASLEEDNPFLHTTLFLSGSAETTSPNTRLQKTTGGRDKLWGDFKKEVKMSKALLNMSMAGGVMEEKEVENDILIVAHTSSSPIRPFLRTTGWNNPLLTSQYSGRYRVQPGSVESTNTWTEEELEKRKENHAFYEKWVKEKRKERGVEERKEKHGGKVFKSPSPQPQQSHSHEKDNDVDTPPRDSDPINMGQTFAEGLHLPVIVQPKNGSGIVLAGSSAGAGAGVRSKSGGSVRSANIGSGGKNLKTATNTFIRSNSSLLNTTSPSASSFTPSFSTTTSAAAVTSLLPSTRAEHIDCSTPLSQADLQHLHCSPNTLISFGRLCPGSSVKKEWTMRNEMEERYVLVEMCLGVDNHGTNGVPELTQSYPQKLMIPPRSTGVFTLIYSSPNEKPLTRFPLRYILNKGQQECSVLCEAEVGPMELKCDREEVGGVKFEFGDNATVPLAVTGTSSSSRSHHTSTPSTLTPNGFGVMEKLTLTNPYNIETEFQFVLPQIPAVGAAVSASAVAGTASSSSSSTTSPVTIPSPDFQIHPSRGTVPANSTITCTMIYEPKWSTSVRGEDGSGGFVDQPFKGELALLVEGGLRKIIPVTASLPEASIRCRTRVIDFGQTCVGIPSSRYFDIRNDGVRRTVWRLDDIPAGVKVSPSSGSLEKNERVNVTVTIFPTNNFQLLANMTLQVRGRCATNSHGYTTKPIRIQLRAQAILPMIEITEDQDAFDGIFERVVVGEKKERSVTVRNCGSVTTTVLVEKNKLPGNGNGEFVLKYDDPAGTNNTSSSSNSKPDPTQPSITLLSPSALKRSGVHPSYVLDPSLSQSEHDSPSIISLTLPPGTLFKFVLTYCPVKLTGNSSYKFELPMMIQGLSTSTSSGNNSSSSSAATTSNSLLHRTIHASSVKPHLTLSSHSLHFGKRAVIGSASQKALLAKSMMLDKTTKQQKEYSDLIVMKNEDREEVRWCVRPAVSSNNAAASSSSSTSKPHLDTAFKYEPSSGVIPPGQDGFITVYFTPFIPTNYSQVLEVFIVKEEGKESEEKDKKESVKEKPYTSILLTGIGTKNAHDY